MGLEGLLTVVGRAGEAGFAARSENIRRDIIEQKEKAQELRRLNLERIEYNRRISAGETTYQRRRGEEEETYERRSTQEEKDYQRRLAEVTEKEELSYRRKRKESHPLEEKYAALIEILGERDAKRLFVMSLSKGKPAISAKEKIDAIAKVAEMRMTGASEAEMNLVLTTAGLKPYSRYKTGRKIEEGGGWFGIGAKEVDETSFGPGSAEGEQGEVDDTLPPSPPTKAHRDFDELLEKMGGGEAGIPKENIEDPLTTQAPEGILSPTEQKLDTLSPITDPTKPLVDIADMKKVISSSVDLARKTGDAVGAVEKTLLKWNMELGQGIKDALIWAVEKALKGQKESRKALLGQ